MKTKIIKITLLAVVLMFGCKRDQLDFGNLDDITLSPTMAIPLIKTRIALGDVINEDSDSTIVINPNNSISVVYRDDSIATLTAAELIQIDDQDLLSENFEVGEITVGPFASTGFATLSQILDNINPPALGDSLHSRNNSVDYFPEIPEQSAGSYAEQSFANFQEVYVSEGSINLLIINGFPVDLENLVIAIKNKIDSSIVASYNIANFPATSNLTRTVDLSGVKLTNEVFVELENFGSPGSGPNPFDTTKHVYISTDDQIAFQMNVSVITIDSGTVIIPDQFIEGLSDTADLDLGNGEEISKIIMKSGEFTYTINSSFQEDIEIIFNLPTVTNGGAFQETITIAAGATTTGAIDVSGYEFALDQVVAQDFNLLPVTVDVSIKSTGTYTKFTSLDQIQLDVSAVNLEYEYLEGYFGQQVLGTDPFTTKMDFSFIKELKGDFRFFNPHFRLRVASEIGLPSDIQMNVEAFNTSTMESEQLNAPFLVVPFPSFTERGQTIKDTLEINNTNSNVVNFMSLVPDSIYGNGTFRTNPDGNTGEKNFTYADSKVSIGLEVDVPLEIAVDGLVLEDDEGIDWSFSEIEKFGLDSIQLNFNITNGFPLDADLQLIMEDSIGGVIDTIFINALLAAPVDAEGRVIAPTTYINSIFLEGQELTNFLGAEVMRVKAIINTFGSDVPTKVTLFTDYFIELQLSAKAQITQTL